MINEETDKPIEIENHAILLHLHYQELWPEFKCHLEKIIGNISKESIFRKICSEGEKFVAKEDCIVAYGHGSCPGLDSEYFFYKNLTRGQNITFDNKTFGDPRFNFAKSGFVFTGISQEKNYHVDLYVTINTTETLWYEDIKSNATEVFLVENKGMDFGGFLYAYDQIKHIDYKTITKLHGKKKSLYPSRHKGLISASEWQQDLYSPLIVGKNYIDMLDHFENDEKIHMCGSRICFRSEFKGSPSGIKNQKSIGKVNDILKLPNPDWYDFVAGSIFSVSKNYLDRFLQNKGMEIYEIMEDGFEFEGLIGHALERLIGTQIKHLQGRMQLL